MLKTAALNLAALFATVGQAQTTPCGSIANAYGPFDFRTDKDKLPIVTSAHFTPEVEALIRGATGAVGGDIDYTLRAIPNHPNALMSMMRLGDKERSEKPYGSRYTVECWFDRAIRFRPDDTMVRMIYTSFLTKKNRRPEAIRQLEIVLPLAKDNALTQYNIGMLYFDLQDYPAALRQANKAMELGLGLSDLRDKLRGVGQWKDPVEAADPAASAPAGMASAVKP